MTQNKLIYVLEKSAASPQAPQRLFSIPKASSAHSLQQNKWDKRGFPWSHPRLLLFRLRLVSPFGTSCFPAADAGNQSHQLFLLTFFLLLGRETCYKTKTNCSYHNSSTENLKIWIPKAPIRTPFKLMREGERQLQGAGFTISSPTPKSQGHLPSPADPSNTFHELPEFTIISQNQHTIVTANNNGKITEETRSRFLKIFLL